MKRQKEYNNIVLIIFFIVLILVSISVTALLYTLIQQNTPKVIASQTLAYDFNVQEHVGMNLDNDILHFGGGPPGSVLSRSINVSVDLSGVVIVSYEGDGILVAAKNNFAITSYEPIELDFSLEIPEDMEPGMYGGTITVVVVEEKP